MSGPAVLALADGTIFRGQSIGAKGNTTGEVVFNTALTGYQEILTDPSYARQIVTLTCPHIGNTGATPEDLESTQVYAAGLIIRDLSLLASSWRANESLPEFLERGRIVAIAGIDTRKLTRLLREKGAQAGCIMTGDKADEVAAVIAARKFPGLKGMDLAKVVTTKRGFQWNEGNLWPERARAPIRSPQRLHVVAYDFGIKRNILRLLADSGCRMTVVPAQTSAQDALALAPDGIFLSNGPGDPEPCTYAIEATKKFLCTDLPVFGICLGHQILGLAAGARTVKMKFGHHGANHPVQDLESGRVFITCQNHGFAVDETTLPEGVKATHRSLFDGSLQGIAFSERPVFGFQGHPEASPGPHDLRPLFERFNHLMLRRLQAQLRAAEDTLRRQLVGGGR
ncbi:MAG: glutamine-hydrolyzing carbamoyl-phosphate synthase small subunit [Gammaproteobacteria bacterium]|nr:MAG: glutamine-hydrolyzing carbamoyl-phosphate synthase small subunit [Gammaproteobacteria bacterium]TLZ32303.1 MAG: glutamine-hydrolyzing carbamoyl-phosphate synthase small subunit [Gammaproteobacteria bacterium]TLZ54690.1 MAG: glutamine-hydrolyzing carbamoyl-phosphate synthase small subunit [Gammaproteobacteria bacterium]TLZ63432.1 MAG: glutamine-hydrolyzing carbamoyl-phosphate synthase small subunit [Gammaproteobacteria bacterium]